MIESRANKYLKFPANHVHTVDKCSQGHPLSDSNWEKRQDITRSSTIHRVFESILLSSTFSTVLACSYVILEIFDGTLGLAVFPIPTNPASTTPLAESGV